MSRRRSGYDNGYNGGYPAYPVLKQFDWRSLVGDSYPAGSGVPEWNQNQNWNAGQCAQGPCGGYTGGQCAQGPCTTCNNGQTWVQGPCTSCGRSWGNNGQNWNNQGYQNWNYYQSSCSTCGQNNCNGGCQRKKSNRCGGCNQN